MMEDVAILVFALLFAAGAICFVVQVIRDA